MTTMHGFVMNAEKRGAAMKALYGLLRSCDLSPPDQVTAGVHFLAAVFFGNKGIPPGEESNRQFDAFEHEMVDLIRKYSERIDMLREAGVFK